jgi:Invasin, domain 3/Bacterial Ig-like domain (group 1)
MNFRRIALPLLFCLALLPAVGCDKATPVAPTGTVLTLSANPSKIGLNGRSTITIVGRKPDGNPLNPGTEVRLTTDRGTIDPVVTVGQGGVATATLRADGRPGTATVSAATADASVDTSVQIGESDDTRPTLIVTASPNNVPVGGTATITVIARNADGTPVAAGQQVILTSNLGTIEPNRPRTQNDGTATATLRAGDQAGTATITAVLGTSEAETAEVTIRDAATAISVQANPRTIQRAGGEVTLTAFVTNSQGLPIQGAPVTFAAQRGELEFTGTVFTNTSGVAENTLTLDQDDLPAGVDAVRVEARTTSGTGGFLVSTTEIDVQ